MGPDGFEDPFSPGVLKQAEEVINGPRREAYGDAVESFKKIASMWSVVFKTEVTPRQVAQAMICLKVARDVNKAAEDNLVDIIGYAALAEKL